jgi:serine/threonine protein kinase
MDAAAEAPANDDRRDARQAENFRKTTTGLNDMYDDVQGYYNFRVGELMGSRFATTFSLAVFQVYTSMGPHVPCWYLSMVVMVVTDILCRYEVIKASGKGVFSSVVTAADKLRQDPDGGNPLVAIKVIRANDTMYKAGKLELAILNKLGEEDRENRRHVIRLLRSFEYRNHLCLVRDSFPTWPQYKHLAHTQLADCTSVMQVFEHMQMNLRELTRKVGVGRGIRIDAVGQLALQMLVAIKHLRNTGILHADIKPDNILINSRMNKIKLCDLGSATFARSHNEPTPYLVSRFYRAPEVILGLPYGEYLPKPASCAAEYKGAISMCLILVLHVQTIQWTCGPLLAQSMSSLQQKYCSKGEPTMRC